MNIPMEGRMQPYDRYHEKELDGVEQDRVKHPRLRPTDYVDDGLMPEDLGKEDDLTPEEAAKRKHGLSDEDEEGDSTIFNMDDKDPAKGGDIFRMHDQGTAGWGFVTHAPDSAGMVGLDRFTWENKRDMYDNASDKYKLLLPQT
ncbi:MAG: hypothetical protein JSS66_05200 [Armatimonadetes bacterium]|nr:hypothetical protein [Armatimonadota bacterium]